jgi:hypothetical protein
MKREPGLFSATQLGLFLYNRQWWGNFIVTDNLAVGPADYQNRD